MNFLFPQVLLFGLLALAIPIIIHLFHLRKTRKLQFSNTRFLKQVQSEKKSRLNIKHWLVLAARLLFILFLVLAFAQPFIPSKSGVEQAKVVRVYIDNSLSMSNEMPQTGSALDNAVVYAEQILDIYPDNTRFQLLTNDFAPFSNFPKSKEATRDVLTELNYSPVTRSVAEVLGRLESNGEGGRQTEDVYFISDFQRSTLGGNGSVRPDSTYRYYLVPMENNTISNVSIDSLFLGAPYLLAGEENSLNVIVRNGGTEQVSDIIFKLFVDDLQIANASANISAGSTETVTFTLSPEATTISEATKKGRISFEEFPVTFDNDFYFSLQLVDQVKIVELVQSNESSFNAVFGNRNLFDFSTYSLSNVDYNQLYTADLVILYEPEELPDGLLASLINYRDQGGSILIIPGTGSSERQIELLSQVNGLSTYRSDRRMELSAPDMEDPFFANIFEGSNRRIDMPEATPVINIGTGGSKLLSFKNKDVFLTMNESGEGRIFLMAGPLSAQYSDFTRHALFVPVMYRLASLSKSDPGRLYYPLDERAVTLSADSMGAEDVIRMIKGDEELIPLQQYNSGRLILDLPRFSMAPGYYDLALRDSVMRVLAFNYSSVESALEQAGLSEITDSFFNGVNVEIFAPEDAQAFRKELESRFTGLPLWKYA
ncbi:MAG: BatA domain-containing protein [Cyclobacteriaceae bacterium]